MSSSTSKSKCETYRIIAQLTNDLVWEWDLKNNTVQRVMGLDQSLGYLEGDLSSDVLWWRNKIHPDDKKRVLDSMRKAISDPTRSVWKEKFRFKQKNGKYLSVCDEAHIIRNTSGEAVKAVGAMRDIDEQKKNEKKLRMRLQLQKAISDLGQRALSRPDIRELFQTAVEQLHQILDLEYTKVLELLPNKKRLVLRAGVGWNEQIQVDTSTVDTGKNSQAGYTLKTKKPVIVKDLRKEKRFNGPPLLQDHGVCSGMSVILYGKDEPWGVLGAHTTKKRVFTQDDIDYLQSVANILSFAIQRNQFEEELLHIQGQFKALYDANIIGVMYERLDGDIIEVNDAFLHMIGYSRDELGKKTFNWKDITPKEYYRIDKKAEAQVKETGIAQPYEKEYIRKDGARVPVILGAVQVDGESEKVLVFALDITERKELEMRKDEFMSIASHELKTPLTSIKGYTQILERIIEQMGDDKLKKYLKKTNLYVDRLNSLIAELLDISKIQAGKLIIADDIFSLDSLICESIESVQHFSSRHKINYKGNYNFKVKGDRNRLEQVMTNLLTNAMKYSPDGGDIDVSVSRKNGEVTAQITDHGIGISKKDQKHLFNRFYRVESSSKRFSGLGIGLYISYEIVKRHGGTMYVESKKGKGSTFSFTLPVYKEHVRGSDRD